MTFPEFRTMGVIGWYLNNGSKSMLGGILLLVLALIAPVAVGYFIGSLNFGLIISKKRFNDDVRTHGSGNAGTTNMLRTYGKTAAVMTFLGDFMKSVVSVLIGTACFGMMGAHLGGIACIVGHAFPVYYHFKGGKGVACAAGMILAISPVTFLILFLFFAIIVGWTKYVSLGSIMCMLLYPVILDSIEPVKGPWMLIAIACTALVIWLHRENIRRLREGKENKISFGKKKENMVTDPEEETTEEENRVSSEKALPQKRKAGKRKYHKTKK